MKLTVKHKERFKKTQRFFRGKAVSFRIDQVKIPENQLATREFLVHPGAVGVLPFISPNRIVLVKQYRYPIEQFTYEIPAGKLAKGEDPLDCVGRELEEETGYQAKKIKKLVSYWPTAAFSTEVIHLYVATDLVETEANPDEDEFIEIVTVSPRQLKQLIKKGRIQDSKTLIAYLAWKNLR
jgi:ADP-ribose pyrophosphatase